MALKIKLTKNELKRQKDILKRLQRYLPTLELKKQQLLAEIRRIQDKIEQVDEQRKNIEEDVKRWVAVFGEPVDFTKIFKVVAVKTTLGNIAGSDIPIFEGIVFEDYPYDYEEFSLWVDRGAQELKRNISLRAESKVLKKQQEIIREELRVTVQRINLFEKVKIPQTKEGIRKIRIFLGDQQTAEVVRGKISKSNLERKKEEEVAV